MTSPCRVCGTPTPEVVNSHDGAAHDLAGNIAYDREQAIKGRVASRSAEEGAAMTDDKVLRTWLRYDDVECVRCKRLAGYEEETCYVVAEGVICTECVTPEEVARAVNG